MVMVVSGRAVEYDFIIIPMGRRDFRTIEFALFYTTPNGARRYEAGLFDIHPSSEGTLICLDVRNFVVVEARLFFPMSEVLKKYGMMASMYFNRGNMEVDGKMRETSLSYRDLHQIIVDCVFGGKKEK